MIYTEYFSQKMKKNVEKYIHMTDGEKLVAFIDFTFFGQGKRGLLCTTSRLVKFNKKKRREFFLDHIQHLEAREVNPNTYEYKLILLDTAGMEHDITSRAVPNDELKVFVLMINNHLNMEQVPRKS